MKTLLDPRDRRALEDRLGRLRPDSPRRWGRMTAPQMICHLTDAFRGVTGERSAGSPAALSPPPSLLNRTLVRWVALYSPMPWPRGMRTRPEADQEQGGTPPADFEADLASLRTATERFLANLDAVAARPHYLFGTLSRSEWARWAYRHADHHLTQFDL
jgi:hypothetical protein